MNRIEQLSVTPSVSKQSQQQEFGDVLKTALQHGVRTASVVSGAVLPHVPGVGVVSAAVSAVTSLAQQPARTSAASTGVVNLNSTVGGAVIPVSSGFGAAGGTAGGMTGAAVAGDMTGMVSEMRNEANRSMAMQMAMQQESREYNTITNILKVRHDSAKAAINNIR
jgi:hypothetical protein